MASWPGFFQCLNFHFLLLLNEFEGLILFFFFKSGNYSDTLMFEVIKRKNLTSGVIAYFDRDQLIGRWTKCPSRDFFFFLFSEVISYIHLNCSTHTHTQDVYTPPRFPSVFFLCVYVCCRLRFVSKCTNEKEHDWCLQKTHRLIMMIGQWEVKSLRSDLADFSYNTNTWILTMDDKPRLRKKE